MKTESKVIRKITLAILSTVFCVGAFSCQDDIRTDGYSTNDVPELLPLSEEQKAVIAYLPKNVIIAHRGTEFWAPEESEAAMRWARNMGADYIECDPKRRRMALFLLSTMKVCSALPTSKRFIRIVKMTIQVRLRSTNF